MSCDVNKFTISKGSDNTFVFTIKQDNSTLPLVIEAGDTFFASLVSLEGNVPYPNVTEKAMSVDNADNGKVSLTIPKEDTVDLEVKRGGEADRYYLRPTYKLTLDCSTVNNGDFIARVPEVYVD